MLKKTLLHATLASALLAAPALAQEAAPSDAAKPAADQQAGKVGIELNKLEPVDQACRIYLLLRNDTDVNFTALQLELVSFAPDGVINQRVAVDLAPLQPKKTLVKLFDVQNTNCDSVSRLLLNDALRCESDKGEVKDCLALMAPSSKGKVEFWK
jgi:hypothetical protein